MQLFQNNIGKITSKTAGTSTQQLNWHMFKYHQQPWLNIGYITHYAYDGELMVHIWSTMT